MIIGAGVLLVSLGIVSLFVFLNDKKVESKRVPIKKPSEAPKYIPLCLLYGDVKDTKIDARKGVDALGNMLRLRFMAVDVEDCKESTMEYCQNLLEKGFVPGKVGLIIRGHSRLEKYTVSKDCVFKFIPEED